jgi:hypothetical protein
MGTVTDPGGCESCGRAYGERHKVLTEPPDLADLERWIFDLDNTEATDGCEVEPDGYCEHGHLSWLRQLGMI